MTIPLGTFEFKFSSSVNANDQFERFCSLLLRFCLVGISVSDRHQDFYLVAVLLFDNDFTFIQHPEQVT